MRRFFSLTAGAMALMLLGSEAQATSDPNQGASVWKEFEGQYYRLDPQGDFSCYSENGKDCMAGIPSTDPDKVRPLSCGRQHQDRWGGTTGYDTPGHWCNTAHANLFATWHDYEILGHPGKLSTNANGDPMCLSTDGVTCLWGDARNNLPPETRIVPLVCGKAHLRDYGITGYDQETHPGHWCQTDEIAMQRFDVPGSLAIAPRTIKLTESAPDVGPPDGLSRLRFELGTPPWQDVDGPRFILRLSTDDVPRLRLTGVKGRMVEAEPTGPLPMRQVTMVLWPRRPARPVSGLAGWAPIDFDAEPSIVPLSHLSNEWTSDASNETEGDNRLTVSFTSSTPTAWTANWDLLPRLAEVVMVRNRPTPRIAP